MSHRPAAWCAALIVAGMGALAPAAAQELPLCSELAAGASASPVYVAGSSAAEPLIKRLGAQLLLKKRLAVVYQPIGSCRALDKFTKDVDRPNCTPSGCLSGPATIYSYPDGTTTDESIIEIPCRIENTGKHLDIALADVHYETCMGTALPSEKVVSLTGPAVAMVFAVPYRPNATRLHITAEEAYSVFGLSCGGGVEPWTDSKKHFIQRHGSGTAMLLSTVMGVPVDKLWGVEPPAEGGSGARAVANALLEASANGSTSAIGLLPSSIVDDLPPNKVTTLAFRAWGQQRAFTPDQVLANRDKRYLRSGAYVPFGYLRFFMRRGEAPLSGARQFFGVMEGTVQVEGVDVRRLAAKANFVPQCAMRVKRETEALNVMAIDPAARRYFRDLQPYSPPVACHCMFEETVHPTGQTPFGCRKCTTDEQCSGVVTGTKCVDNYCTGTAQ